LGKARRTSRRTSRAPNLPRVLSGDPLQFLFSATLDAKPSGREQSCKAHLLELFQFGDSMTSRRNDSAPAHDRDQSQIRRAQRRPSAKRKSHRTPAPSTRSRPSCLTSASNMDGYRTAWAP
jgi:hypothetical protein